MHDYEYKSVLTPLDPNEKLLPLNEILTKYPFQELTESLTYLSVGTRPDIAFVVNYLSQFCNCYSQEHWLAVKRLSRYLKGTIDCGIKYVKYGGKVKGFMDLD